MNLEKITQNFRRTIGIGALAGLALLSDGCMTSDYESGLIEKGVVDLVKFPIKCTQVTLGCAFSFGYNINEYLAQEICGGYHPNYAEPIEWPDW